MSQGEPTRMLVKRRERAHAAAVPRHRRIVVVPWPGSLELRWAPLTRWHGQPVEYDSTAGAVYVRVPVWASPLDSPLRAMSAEQLERELVEVAARALGVEPT